MDSRGGLLRRSQYRRAIFNCLRNHDRRTRGQPGPESRRSLKYNRRVNEILKVKGREGDRNVALRDLRRQERRDAFPLRRSTIGQSSPSPGNVARPRIRPFSSAKRQSRSRELRQAREGKVPALPAAVYAAIEVRLRCRGPYAPTFRLVSWR